MCLLYKYIIYKLNIYTYIECGKYMENIVIDINISYKYMCKGNATQNFNLIHL